jgi:hypothetical protein
MKILVTVFEPPNAPRYDTILLGHRKDILELEGDGITKPVRRELYDRGYTNYNTSDGKMVRLEVEKQ